jgi:[ribosomal protein S5]-alanine N-acetyltransferase
MVAPAARRRGIATASVRLLVPWAFETLRLGRLQIHADAHNAASHRVIERAGFTREGVLRSYDLIHGERVDCVFFSLLPGEWRSAKAAG